MSVDMKAVLAALTLAACATSAPPEPASVPQGAPPPPRPFVECKLAHPLPTIPKPSIIKPMQSLKPAVGGCFDRYKQPGTAALAIDVGADGKC